MAHTGAALVGVLQTVPSLPQGGALSSLRRDMGVQTDAPSLLSDLPLQWALLVRAGRRAVCTNVQPFCVRARTPQAEEAMQAQLPAILARMRGADSGRCAAAPTEGADRRRRREDACQQQQHLLSTVSSHYSAPPRRRGSASSARAARGVRCSGGAREQQPLPW
jgi:hypothetical protein